MDIIHRNINRLVYLEAPDDREAIEPMSEWKWKKLYSIVRDFGLGPWIVDGMRAYSDDFFLQPSVALRDQFLALNGERNEELLRKFKLNIHRSQRVLNRFTRESLQAYFNDFMHTIRNIEE